MGVGVELSPFLLLLQLLQLLLPVPVVGEVRDVVH
jgi:hypothetical protein